MQANTETAGITQLKTFLYSTTNTGNRTISYSQQNFTQIHNKENSHGNHTNNTK